jgi:hypothetical protein
MNVGRRRGVIIAILMVLCLALVGGYVLWSRTANSGQPPHFDQIVGFGEEIQYDDFAFSVLAVTKTHTLGNAVAQGQYYIISIRVANHARRVDFRFSDQIVVLVDDRGREYRASTEGQTARAAAQGPADACAPPLPAGDACVTEVVFDAPADVRDLYLKISIGPLLGDVLDAVTFRYRSKAIKVQ